MATNKKSSNPRKPAAKPTIKPAGLKTIKIAGVAEPIVILPGSSLDRGGGMVPTVRLGRYASTRKP